MDNITIEPNLNKRDVHPPGPFGAICVDIIDLGMRVNEQYGKAAQSIVFVFKTSKGEVQSRDYSVSLAPLSNLKKFLEGWRGAKFTAEELGAKLTLASFQMKPAMISVEHSPSKSDPSKIYANIGAIMPLPEGMPVPSADGYVRAPFWAEKKQRYADEFAAFMSAPPKDKIDESMDPVPF